MNSIIENLMRLARVRKTDLHLEEFDIQKILGGGKPAQSGEHVLFHITGKGKFVVTNLLV